MRQSAWELDWDCVKGLYDFHLGVPTYIVDDAVHDQWSPTASSLGAQSWTDCDAEDILYSNVVLLSLAPLNLLDPAEGREQNKQGTGSAQYVYSAVSMFVHPAQTLITISEAVNFLKVPHDDIVREGRSSGWCVLCKLRSYETSRFFPMIPHMLHLVLLASASSVASASASASICTAHALP